jgi:hypothetical protein
MIVRSINIAREGDYGQYGAVAATKPFIARIKVEGISGNVELVLSSDMSAAIVKLIAKEVAAAGKATAQAMTAECLNVVALPSKAQAAQ